MERQFYTYNNTIMPTEDTVMLIETLSFLLLSSGTKIPEMFFHLVSMEITNITTTNAALPRLIIYEKTAAYIS
jgi:hypothetical protein